MGIVASESTQGLRLRLAQQRFARRSCRPRGEAGRDDQHGDVVRTELEDRRLDGCSVQVARPTGTHGRILAIGSRTVMAKRTALRPLHAYEWATSAAKLAPSPVWSSCSSSATTR